MDKDPCASHGLLGFGRRAPYGIASIMMVAEPGFDKRRTDDWATRMTDIDEKSGATLTRPPLSDAAKRALLEAEARRKAKPSGPENTPTPEIGGRDGPDPARYGDWEVKGIASDF